MRTDTKKVRTGKKVVAEVDIIIYETVEELIEKESSERILGMFNKQNAVRIMGNERNRFTMTKIGKMKRFEIGYNLLPEILGQDKMMEVLGNMEKLREVIESNEMQEAIDSYIEDQKGKVEDTDTDVETEV